MIGLNQSNRQQEQCLMGPSLWSSFTTGVLTLSTAVDSFAQIGHGHARPLKTCPSSSPFFFLLLSLSMAFKNPAHSFTHTHTQTSLLCRACPFVDSGTGNNSALGGQLVNLSRSIDSARGAGHLDIYMDNFRL